MIRTELTNDEKEKIEKLKEEHSYLMKSNKEIKQHIYSNTERKEQLKN